MNDNILSWTRNAAKRTSKPCCGRKVIKISEFFNFCHENKHNCAYRADHCAKRKYELLDKAKPQLREPCCEFSFSSDIGQRREEEIITQFTIWNSSWCERDDLNTTNWCEKRRGDPIVTFKAEHFIISAFVTPAVMLVDMVVLQKPSRWIKISQLSQLFTPVCLRDAPSRSVPWPAVTETVENWKKIWRRRGKHN